MEELEANILKASEWYAGLDSGYGNIEQLLVAQAKLSATTVSLASYLSELKIKADLAEVTRKKFYAKAFVQHAQEMPMGKAGEAATQDVGDYLEREKKMQAEYAGGKLILHQANEVLNGIRQRISYLKDEKNLGRFIENG